MDSKSGSNEILHWKKHPWGGVIPATLCAFHKDESVDEEAVDRYIVELAKVPGITGLTCNGHTGEIMSLRPPERAAVTRVVAGAVRKTGRSVKVISGIMCEGSLDAIDHARAAKEAGANAILLMPPHHWLRFGRSSRTAVGYVEDVATGADIPIVIHQYPAWTKAGYTLAEMLEMVKIPQVVSIKMGTRDLSRWRYDYETLKAAAPHATIITCHDEFLYSTLVEGADGALIGFAGFVPELMVELVHSALDGDTPRARKAQELVSPLARLIYGFGEPGCNAHQRMKTCLWLMGKFSSPRCRGPLRPIPLRDVVRLGKELEALGFQCPTDPDSA